LLHAGLSHYSVNGDADVLMERGLMRSAPRMGFSDCEQDTERDLAEMN
jgi:hypothetical protein